jgi:adenylyltransferase/sulfurtransferase
MPITVHLPTALRAYAEKQETVMLEGLTIGEVVGALTRKYAQLGKHLLGEDGNVRNFVNLYLNDEDVRRLKGLETPVREGDTLLIVPAIAGGIKAWAERIDPGLPTY